MKKAALLTSFVLAASALMAQSQKKMAKDTMSLDPHFSSHANLTEWSTDGEYGYAYYAGQKSQHDKELRVVVSNLNKNNIIGDEGDIVVELRVADKNDQSEHYLRVGEETGRHYLQAFVKQAGYFVEKKPQDDFSSTAGFVNAVKKDFGVTFTRSPK